MIWAARVLSRLSGVGLSGIVLSGAVLSGIGPLSRFGPEPGLGPQPRQRPGTRSRPAVWRRPGVRLGPAAPRGRHDRRSAVPAVLAGVLPAGAARAVHDAGDADAGDAMEASTRRMSHTVRTVPPSVPVTLDFPVRG